MNDYLPTNSDFSYRTPYRANANHTYLDQIGIRAPNPTLRRKGAKILWIARIARKKT